jgi:phosphatidylglycerophosphate synthase
MTVAPAPEGSPPNGPVVPPPGPDAPDAYIATLGHLPVAAVFAAAGAGLMAAIFQLGAAPPIAALALFVLLAVLVVGTTPLPRGGLGAGSRVTLARIVLVCLIGSVVAVPPPAIGDDLLWALVPIAAVAALLDAVDGKVARATGTVSPFGARLDMEADALFILILSVLLWRIDKAGVWVIAIGAMRYAFLAAMLVVPALRGALPSSRRRQTVCVVQVVALIIGLAPAVPPLATAALAGAALALLAWSFAVDTGWLLRHGAPAPATPHKPGESP